jgi:hypothetical protein
VAVLSGFKVVLTATRSPGQSALAATVSAAGYESTAQGWKLIAAKTIGKPNQRFWYSVSVCGLTVTQLKPEPSSAAPSDTVTVTLLMALRSAAPAPSPRTSAPAPDLPGKKASGPGASITTVWLTRDRWLWGLVDEA